MKAAGKKSSLLTKQGPTAKAGGASGSRAHPTFSACPAGQGRLQHTDGMFCPPLTRLKADFNIPSGMLGFLI